MNLETYEEDNPNLDGDYKAVLKRRREIAETKKTSSWEREATLAVISAAKDAGSVALLGKNVEQLLREELRQRLFDAVDNGQSSVVNELVANAKRLKLSLTDPSLRLDTEETVLHRALLKGNESLASTFVDEGGQDLVLATYITEVEGNKSKKTCLHIASELGSLAMVKRLMQVIPAEGVRKNFLMETTLVLPEGQRARNLTCLHIAAKAGKTEMVRYYICECQMSVNLKNNKNDTPLLWAANDGRCQVVELLIDLGARVDEQNDKGSSALHWAVRGRHIAVIEALLKGKANVNIRRKLGLVCPLVMASAMAYDDVVKLLIKYGADVNTRIHIDETALHYAAGEGATDVCQTLISAGALLDAVDGKGDTPLLEAAASGHVYTVALLVRAGADVRHANFERLTVWNYAVSTEKNDMLDVLLQLSDCWQKPSPTVTASVKSVRARPLEFPKGITPLHIASKNGDAGKIDLMLKRGADPLSKDNKGNTFLHIAAIDNHVGVLSEYGDETTAAVANDDGNTPLHLACKFGNSEAIQILTKKSKLQAVNKAGMTVLHEAAKSKKIDAASVGFLITQVIQSHDWTLLDAMDKNKNTALHLAVISANVQVVHSLKPLSAKIANSSGNTPLHLAVTKKDEAVFLQLLEDRTYLGKEVFDVLNTDKKSILNLAIENRHIQHVEHIINAGADLGMRCREGYTALHSLVDLIMDDGANQSAYMQIVKLIVSKSYSWWATMLKVPVPHEDSHEEQEATSRACARLFLEIPNDNHLTVLQYAAAKGCAVLVQYILNMPRLFRRRAENDTAFIYDVTDLTPATVIGKSREVKKNATAPAARNKAVLTEMGGTKVGPQEDVSYSGGDSAYGAIGSESLLELIVSNENLSAAATVLDIEPVASVVSHYWTTYQWLFGIMMVLHLLHMSLLSYYGPFLMSESLANCSDLVALGNASLFTAMNSSFLVRCPAPARSSDIAIQCILLIAPSSLLLFDAFDVSRSCFSAVKSGKNPIKSDLSSSLGTLLRLTGVFQALSTITWYVLFRLNMLDQDFVLAAALVSGWVFSLNFTRGFRAIHHFNLMLRHMLFRDVAKFLLFFAFVLIGFGMAQYTMIRADPNYNSLNVLETFFLLFNWFIGMGNFWDMPANPYLMTRYAFEVSLFIFFCVLSTIVFLNLLIATMSDSYSEIRDTSSLFWKVNSIQMAIDIEKLVPPVTRALRRIGRGHASMQYDGKEIKWFCTVKARRENETRDSSNDLKDSVTALDNKLTALQSELSSLKVTLDQLSMHVQENRPKLLKTLGNALAAGNKDAGALKK